MKRRKIVIIGGGSNAWTPNIVKDMLLTDALSESEFVLYDINKKAADLNRDFLLTLIELSLNNGYINSKANQTDGYKTTTDVGSVQFF